jgi:hypothetical protein
VIVVVINIVVVNDGSVIVDDVSVVERDVAIVVVTLISGFAGTRITNFNSKERVTTKIAKMIKEMAMIQRCCGNLGRSLVRVLFLE